MKNSIARYSLALCTVCLSFSVSPALAGFTFTFTPSGTGGVDVVGTGSGASDRVDPVASNDWDIQDFVTNYVQSAFGNSPKNADTVTGTLTNLTTSTTVNILSFQIDADGGSGFDNDIDFDTDAVIAFSLGDEMSLSLTASYDAGELSISDLVPGTHIDEGHTQGAGIAEESFGITTVHVVPEPSCLALALACFAAVGVSRRR